MLLNEIGTLVGIVLGVLGSVLGTTIGLYKYFTGRMDKIQKECSEKIARVYERFDEYKTNVESKFVHMDMCELKHENNNVNFIRLEQRVEEGFKRVDAKLDELQKLFINNHK